MNPLAQDLNQTIIAANPHVFAMLSKLGKEIFFPSKGILSQSAEASKLAKRFNATIGTAMSDGQAMFLPSLMEQLPGIKANDALLYAPSAGMPALRSCWREKTLHDNPSLAGRGFSLPVVTNGLSHGLSIVADMFINPGDVFIYPDKNWDNYHLNYMVRSGAEPKLFAFFNGKGFHVEAFRQALREHSAGREKVVVLLNFPNNPSGYAPTEAEGRAMAEALIATAESGVNVVAIIDDAYYGLFYEPDVMRESLFAKLAGRHPRLLAIKADAATKEVYVWGLRVGFLSLSVGGAAEGDALYEALTAKMGGLIRSVVSNCSALSQHLIAKSLQSLHFYEERAEKVALMRRRAARVKAVLANPRYAEAWEPYPFNSGYFMCLYIKRVDAERLRQRLLQHYGVGTISITPTDLRVAFSCLEEGDIQEVFDLIYQAWQDLAAEA
jgi:aspartate/methionine/tyrosine aminotransferase